MYLAIGDVVRDHTDMELGTVIGWYPKKAPQEARPVPILSEP